MSTPASPSSPLDLSLLSTSAPPPLSPQLTPLNPLAADLESVSASTSELVQASAPDDDGFVQHFNPTLYSKSEAACPLYEESNVTEAIAHYMVWFTSHPGTSKDAIKNFKYAAPQHSSQT